MEDSRPACPLLVSLLTSSEGWSLLRRECDKDLPEKGSDLILLSGRSLPARPLTPKMGCPDQRGKGEAGPGQTVSTGELYVLFSKPLGMHTLLLLFWAVVYLPLLENSLYSLK